MCLSINRRKICSCKVFKINELNPIEMKNSTVLFIGLLLLICDIADCNKNEARKKLAVDNSLGVVCTPELYNLTATWADEFCKLYPDVKIEVKNITESSLAENINLSENLGLISSEHPVTEDRSTWHVVIGRDVTVPIFNSENPFVNELCQQGISLEGFTQIFKNPELRYWGTLINSKENAPVNFFMIDDESINSGLAKLLGLDQFTFDGIKVENGEELISSVQKDPYSIGFCKITDILDLNRQSIAESIKLLPIDRNSNGRIDYMEELYDDLNTLSRGVWTGKYPKALVNNLYFISPVKPTDEIEIAFIKWILTDGQQFLDNYGFSDLLYTERQTKVNLLDDNEFNIISADEKYATPIWVLLILGSFPVILITLIVVNLQRVSYNINKKEDFPDTAFESARVFDEQLVDIPSGLYYDKTHTWAFMERDGLVRIGIDDFLQHIIGPLTRIKMKSRGEKIRKGTQVLSIIQNGKQLNIHSPVSGTIKEQNKVLNNNPSLVNTSPYSDGWVYIIEPTNWVKESQFLIMWEKYKGWLKSEFSRLKDFLAVSIKPDVEYAHTLQDGGELKDGILMDLGPEVWEDFQTNFLNLPA